MAETFESGRGNKQLIGMIVLSLSIIASAFGIGREIQKLVDRLETVATQHRDILSMKPCRQE